METEANEADGFLSDRQLADMLGVTTRTTLRWRRDGEGPKYVRAGLRRVLYWKPDVLEWAAARTYAHLAAEAVGREAGRCGAVPERGGPRIPRRRLVSPAAA
jgi:predicted DNA-binding transcriptional regulator AlpA